MERSAPTRKPLASTADLLTWTEAPPQDPAASASRQPHQPTDGVSKVVFGGQITEEEAESILKRKPCSGPKLKEMTGSGIFATDSEDELSEPGSSFSTPNQRTGLRMYQQTVNAMSQISFSTDETVSSHKKPTSLAEVAKQRELTGSLLSESDDRLKKHLSDAKCKELSGHDIFAAPEVLPRSSGWNLEMNENDLRETTPRNLQSPVKAGGPSNLLFGEEPEVKSAKKIHTQKVAELTGNGIFKDDATPGAAEKTLSTAKLKEMSGSDIFADGKAPSREYLGGVRKPPGGESSIALV
ncbi:hypothetical protein MUK42_23604 [Musa troglodytarum]|uniref:DUF4057 domain-containing protein n=1 Tax=Musa troglodytarum TaxID=320322 RepID=A0A9E7K9K7_9LILI|nr:hypothetical protein MUK42_23604 [Musa troglodytarum]